MWPRVVLQATTFIACLLKLCKFGERFISMYVTPLHCNIALLLLCNCLHWYCAIKSNACMHLKLQWRHNSNKKHHVTYYKSKLRTVTQPFQIKACDHVLFYKVLHSLLLVCSVCLGRDLYLCTSHHFNGLLHCSCYVTVCTDTLQQNVMHLKLQSFKQKQPICKTNAYSPYNTELL